MEADEIPSIDERLRRRQRDDDDDRHRELSTLFNPYTPGIEDDLDACRIGGKSRREVVADLQEEYNYHRKREDSLGNYTGYCGLSVDDRTVLVDWLIQVHHSQYMCLDSLYLGIAIMDRFFKRMWETERRYYQLYGAASLLLADKYHDGESAIRLDTLTDLCDGAYTHREMARAECVVLKALNGKLAFPTCYTFLELLLSLEPNEEFYRLHHEICMCALDRASLSVGCLYWDPSKVAATALMLANHQWAREGMEFWPHNLRSFTQYSVDDLRNCASSIVTGDGGDWTSVSDHKVVWEHSLSGMVAKYSEKGYPHLFLPYLSDRTTKTLDPLYRSDEKPKSKKRARRAKKRHCPWHAVLNKPCPVHHGSVVDECEGLDLWMATKRIRMRTRRAQDARDCDGSVANRSCAQTTLDG